MELCKYFLVWSLLTPSVEPYHHDVVVVMVGSILICSA